MKKTLKISTLALALSAFLFSCAAPSNTPSGNNQLDVPKQDVPKLEGVKPSEIEKPNGYTPTDGAKYVSEKTQADKVLESIISANTKINQANTALMADPKVKALTEKLKKSGDDYNNFMDNVFSQNTNHNESLNSIVDPETVKVANGDTFEIKNCKAIGHSNVSVSDTNISVDNSIQNIQEVKTTVKGDFGSVKLFTQNNMSYEGQSINFSGNPSELIPDAASNNASSITKTGNSKGYFFDTEDYNGILIINKESSQDYLKQQKFDEELNKPENAKYKAVFDKGGTGVTEEEQKLYDEFMDKYSGIEFSYSATFYDINGNNPFEYVKLNKQSETKKIPDLLKQIDNNRS